MNKCIKCGMCCVAYKLIPLISKEVASGIYEVTKTEHPSSVIKTKSVYFKEWDATLDVCIYFDENTRECIIYDHRPKVCKKHFCDRNSKVEYGRIMARIADECSFQLGSLKE